MISNKCYYALRAMLVLARNEGAGPVTISYIAEEKDIPPRFLEAILRQLKQHGFTDSIRGKEGGYILAQPAKDVTVADIIEVFESPLASASPVNNRPGQPDVFGEVWQQAEDALASVYGNIHFRKLVEREDDLRREAASHYSI